MIPTTAVQDTTINSGTVDTKSAGLNIMGITSLYIEAVELTGDLDGATLTLQCATEDTDAEYSNTPYRLIFGTDGKLFLNNIPMIPFWVRWKVTVKSTIASTATIRIQAS